MRWRWLAGPGSRPGGRPRRLDRSPAAIDDPASEPGAPGERGEQIGLGGDVAEVQGRVQRRVSGGAHRDPPGSHAQAVELEADVDPVSESPGSWLALVRDGRAGVAIGHLIGYMEEDQLPILVPAAICHIVPICRGANRAVGPVDRSVPAVFHPEPPYLRLCSADPRQYPASAVRGLCGDCAVTRWQHSGGTGACHRDRCESRSENVHILHPGRGRCADLHMPCCLESGRPVVVFVKGERVLLHLVQALWSSTA